MPIMSGKKKLLSGLLSGSNIYFCVLLHIVTCVRKSFEIGVWLVGWLVELMQVQTPQLQSCLYVYAHPVSIAVCVDVSHTPTGLWSPESDEDRDTEQRHRLAPLAPCSMLGWKPACRRACLVRWSLLMKHFSHIGQLKRFSPVCVR